MASPDSFQQAPPVISTALAAAQQQAPADSSAAVAVAVAVTPPVPQVAPGGRCGPTPVNLKCNPDQCCSSAGWCGVTAAHCGAGCQPAYGLCDQAAGISKSLFLKVFTTDSDKCTDCPDYGKYKNTQGVAERHWRLFKQSADYFKFKFQNLSEASVFFGHVRHEYGGALDMMLEQCARKKKVQTCWTGNNAFYGRGPIQLSYKDNYAALGHIVSVDLVNKPDKLLDTYQPWAWMSAVAFWAHADFNCMGSWVAGPTCRAAAAAGNVAQVTRRINPPECVPMSSGGGWAASQAERITQVNTVRGLFGLAAIPKAQAWCAKAR